MTDAVITPQAAQALMQQPKICVLDASYGVPDARGAFRARHIPGAQLFDIDAIADPNAPYPHTLPDADTFAAAAGALGVEDDTQVLIYDQTGISFAAARAWWMFRVFGHDRVQVINGGLPAWVAAGMAVEQGEAAERVTAVFTARFRPELYRSFDEIEKISETGSEILLDARAAARFHATLHTIDGDPVPAHVPGSLNLPFDQMLDHKGALKDSMHISDILEKYSLDPRKNLVVACNSGVTACILALGLFQTGHKNTAVFDGSWVEWSDRMQIR